MSVIISLTPIELFLMVSSKSEGAGESPPNTNKGPYPKRVLSVTGLPEGHPWCAAEISDTGRICFGKRWPLPMSARVMDYVAAARKLGILFVPGEGDTGVPRPGDLYALWHPELDPPRWGHIGVVVEARGGTKILGRDGNTSGEGVREGWLVWRKERTLSRLDRLIRWADVFV